MRTVVSAYIVTGAGAGAAAAAICIISFSPLAIYMCVHFV